MLFPPMQARWEKWTGSAGGVMYASRLRVADYDFRAKNGCLTIFCARARVSVKKRGNHKAAQETATCVWQYWANSTCCMMRWKVKSRGIAGMFGRRRTSMLSVSQKPINFMQVLGE